MKLNKDKAVVVDSLHDLRSAIQEFLPGYVEKNPEVKAIIQSEGKNYQVNATPNCTYKQMLLEGFTILKKRVEAEERNKGKTVPIQPINTGGRMWLDDLIRQRLGGIRDGLRVKWTLTEGVFFFDPFTGQITRCSSS